MFHKVSVIGNLGGDPDMRAMQSGDMVCNFSVATNRKWKNADGSPGEETIWWRVSAWGRLAEVCHQYLTKGQLVYLEGTMVPNRDSGGPRVWTDQSGQPRASYEIRVDTMKMLGRNEEGEEQTQARPQRGGYGQQRAPKQTRPSQGQGQANYGGEFDPDEIPF